MTSPMTSPSEAYQLLPKSPSLCSDPLHPPSGTDFCIPGSRLQGHPRSSSPPRSPPPPTLLSTCLGSTGSLALMFLSGGAVLVDEWKPLSGTRSLWTRCPAHPHHPSPATNCHCCHPLEGDASGPVAAGHPAALPQDGGASATTEGRKPGLVSAGWLHQYHQAANR